MPRTINPYYPNQNVTRMFAGIAKQCRTIEECRTELHNENPQISQTLTLRLRKSSPLREHRVAGRALQQLMHAGRQRPPTCSSRGAAAVAAAAAAPAPAWCAPFPPRRILPPSPAPPPRGRPWSARSTRAPTAGLRTTHAPVAG